MKYIDGENPITFDPYIAYLNTIRDQLPAHVWTFASDPRHYRLDTPESLHDSWLESLTIEEPATGDRKERRTTAITLRFLGPMHDRHHVLRYERVHNYEIVGPTVRRGHADLYTHEVRIADDGQAIVHELVFAHGEGADARILIECADIRHEMVLC